MAAPVTALQTLPSLSGGVAVSGLFDLNIEKVLEHWSTAEAVREVIANALDEQSLTGTAEPLIEKMSDGRWQVRDFGRGLRYEHLTQNENPEKLKNPNRVVGKFGVGLKDALATFDRRKVGVQIHSRWLAMSMEKAPKHGFADVVTLQARIEGPVDAEAVGTSVILTGLKDRDVELAKMYFLKYSGQTELERNEIGAVLARGTGPALIYVNGLRVAEEENFLFSYDITSLTAPLRRALNRERSNVGRAAYQERVKAVLQKAASPDVAGRLAADLERVVAGRGHDETQWIDVAQRACQILAANEKVVFVTSDQMFYLAGAIQRAQNDGYRVVVVTDTLAAKLPKLRDLNGDEVLDIGGFLQRWNDSFQFEWVEPDQLTARERRSWAQVEPLLKLVGRRSRDVKDVRISTTMRLTEDGLGEVEGLWDPQEHRIVIKRSCLNSLTRLTAVLLHEVGHAMSGADHGDQDFEDALTELLGVSGVEAVKNRS